MPPQEVYTYEELLIGHGLNVTCEAGVRWD